MANTHIDPDTKLVLLLVARSCTIEGTHVVSTTLVDTAKKALASHGIDWQAPWETLRKEAK